MKTNRNQFDEVLRRMIQNPPQKTSDIKAEKTLLCQVNNLGNFPLRETLPARSIYSLTLPFPLAHAGDVVPIFDNQIHLLG